MSSLANDTAPRAPDEPLPIRQLLVPQAFAHPVREPLVVETPLSRVVLTGPYAYKIKKPVRLDFLDASSLERRERLCEEELRLNRRFAPDLYLDVVPITQGVRGLQFGGSGRPVEFAVRMQQFDPAQQLGAQLARGQVSIRDVTFIATRLADAHSQAASASADSPFGAPGLLQAQMLANFTTLHALLPAAQAALLERLRGWTMESLARLGPLIERRKADGRVRECHGDLHAGNIVRWRQQWLPFDCIEFDPSLRFIDVLSDTAFLFMDLAGHGRRDLAWAFLSRYLEETGDYGGLPLLPLFAVYRALVRAKVDALGAGGATAAQRGSLLARLADRLRIAEQLAGSGVPALILMHGVTASGKSWLSEQLIPQLPALRIRSDLERKRLCGLAPLAQRVCGVGEGPYSQASTDRVYARLLECAEAALQGGCTLIVDASFLQAARRRAFHELAVRHHGLFLIASCHADAATLRERLDTRARGGLDPSEATRDVLEAQLRGLQPLTCDEQAYAVTIDTGQLGAASAGIDALRARLGGAAG